MRYKCAECGDKGHLKFERAMLKKHKTDDRHALVCTDCVGRHRAVESRLRDKKAIRCTCKGSSHNFNNEKCALFPRSAGEKRWPGKNVGVTLDDFEFCSDISNLQEDRNYDSFIKLWSYDLQDCILVKEDKFR